jgi:hypothetical protein
MKSIFLVICACLLGCSDNSSRPSDALQDVSEIKRQDLVFPPDFYGRPAKPQNVKVKMPIK